jgi:chromosome segregation ATPase
VELFVIAVAAVIYLLMFAVHHTRISGLRERNEMLVTDCNARISRIEAARAVASKQLPSLQRELEEKDEEIRKLRCLISEQKVTIEQLGNRAVRLVAEKNQTEMDLAVLKSRLDRVEKAVSHLSQAINAES